MSTLPKENFSDSSYLGALAMKSLAAGIVHATFTKYYLKLGWKDPALRKYFITQAMSSAVGTVLMSTVVSQVVQLVATNNAGIKRVYNQILNAAVTGALNQELYKRFIKRNKSYQGALYQNFEEFWAAMGADGVGEVISYVYLVPLLGLNKPATNTIYN